MRPGLRVEGISRLQSEPDWVRDRRLQSWAIFQESQLPGKSEEEWRYTDLTGLDFGKYELSAPENGRLSGAAQLPRSVRSAADGRMERIGLFVQHNSEVVSCHLDAREATRGVVFTSLRDALLRHPEVVGHHFMAEAVKPTDGKLQALHGALWTGGVLLYVPAGLQVGLPFHSIVWLRAGGLAIFPHTLIVAEANSSVTFVEEYVSTNHGSPSLAVPVVEVVLGPSATVRYVGLQRWGPNVQSFAFQRAVADRDSSMRWVVGSFGGSLARVNVETVLAGAGATAETLGALFADGAQHFDHYTLQDHLAPSTASDLLFKAAVAGNAESVYHGMIRVHKDAQKADAYQINRNLLLSQHARAQSIPKLEIEANDVRCGHGAAVGPVEEDQVYYLMTRGLSRGEAERLVVEGFFEPLLERVPPGAVRGRLRAVVRRKLNSSPTARR